MIWSHSQATGKVPKHAHGLCREVTIPSRPSSEQAQGSSDAVLVPAGTTSLVLAGGPSTSQAGSPWVTSVATEATLQCPSGTSFLIHSSGLGVKGGCGLMDRQQKPFKGSSFHLNASRNASVFRWKLFQVCAHQCSGDAGSVASSNASISRVAEMLLGSVSDNMTVVAYTNKQENIVSDSVSWCCRYTCGQFAKPWSWQPDTIQ